MKQHSPVCVTIHHTAARQNNRRSLAEKMRALQRFSTHPEKLANGKVKPAWPDVPYHFYVGADGKIAEGRNVDFVGDTNTNYNPAGHIQVVLEGNFEVERPTSDQLQSTVRLLAWLCREHKIPPSRVGRHSDYASTACPGKYFDLQGTVSQLKRLSE
jgi:N-acetyl-anhydromuramyl-L-alanine amidase AmpD